MADNWTNTETWPEMTLLPRFLQAKVEEALRDTPVVCILGARQVGKTTLAQQLSEPRA